MSSGNANTSSSRGGRYCLKACVWSIRTHILLFTLLVLTPALGLLIYNASDRRQMRVKNLQDHSWDLAVLLGRSESQLIEGTCQILIALGRIYETEASSSQCSTAFNDLLRRYRRYVNFGVVNPNGSLSCSALPTDRPMNLAGQNWFHQAIQERNFAYGSFQQGPLSGKPVLIIASPVVSAGEVQAVVFAALDLKWLNQFESGTVKDLPEGSMLTKVDEKGVVLAQQPGPEGWIGKPFPLAKIREETLTKEKGLSYEKGPDGSDYLYVYRKLSPAYPDRNVRMIYSIPVEKAFSDSNRIWRQEVISIWVIGCMVMMAALLGTESLIMRRLKGVLDAIRRFKEGDFSARTGILKGRNEMGELGRAFDHMASRLEREITERKKAEAALASLCRELEDKVRERTGELERKNKDLEDFASVASHDLQEPLRKVQMFGDLLQSKYESVIDEQGRGYLRRMQNGAARMQAMLNALLSYSRVTSRAQPFVSVDLNETVREVLANLEVQVRETGAEVEVEELPRALAEPNQMVHLLQNLISNAIKFRKEHERPRVKIASNTKDGFCKICVIDNGIGFDERHLGRIFVPFERLQTARYPGTGIGLAICKKIAERHGGSITAKSAPGKGSTFIIDLPVKQTQSG